MLIDDVAMASYRASGKGAHVGDPNGHAMFRRRFLASAASIVCAFIASTTAPSSAQSAAAPPIALRVDATRAVQGRLVVHEAIPVTAGALTLQYAKWIPGEHAPSGPIPNVAGVRITANGTALAWNRDPVDLYALHLTVPPGVASIDVDFVYLAANSGNYSSARTSTPTLLALTWNKVLLTPRVDDYATQTIVPSIVLPSATWKYATALTTTGKTGATVTFAPVTQEMLIDSPLDAGTHAKTWELGTLDGVPVSLAAFADAEEQLAIESQNLAGLRKLVEQMGALYRHPHFAHYTFLLTVSDVMPGEGVEHHQSSDDGSSGDFLRERDDFVSDGDLLSHEFNHSWDGKYRRPATLATRNLQDPMIDDLLWVYEGMTQFYGELQTERSGLWTREQWLDSLASTYANLDSTRGRDLRPLADTAVAAPFLYGAPRQWESARRSVDFYPEGNLMWLEADVIIRRLSHGARSLDDAARAFFGGPAATGAQVVTYNREDVIAALNAVQPYDWATFFATRVDRLAPHPPDPFTPGGYRLTFTDTPNALDKIRAGKQKRLDARYSLGIVAQADGTVTDIIPGSPADAAGIGPGDKIVAIDDRAFKGQTQLDDALKAAKAAGPVRLLVAGGDVFRSVTIPYTGGPRFPHLVRIEGTPDELGAIATPL